ncbi:MAG: GntR family transcriptional regulator, partial [Candidatus Omnitrophica bacterium]|nr:GntR family transcriptional regulator [Candidatus Omnitrophota bacterium]
MIKIGQYNLLNVVKESAAGIYLDAGDFGEILLLKDDATDQRASKESCEVFLYYDSKEKVMATTQRPYGCVGEFAFLKVVEASPMGAFLDWGLPKDLFVPVREQQKLMEQGERHIVYIYKDPQRNRLVASSRLNNYLNKEPAAYGENEKVGLLIAHETELGINAIVNHSHWGLLYRDEVFQKLKYGQKIDGYVKKVRANNK